MNPPLQGKQGKQGVSRDGVSTCACEVFPPTPPVSPLGGVFAPLPPFGGTGVVSERYLLHAVRVLHAVRGLHGHRQAVITTEHVDPLPGLRPPYVAHYGFLP